MVRDWLVKHNQIQTTLLEQIRQHHFSAISPRYCWRLKSLRTSLRSRGAHTHYPMCRQRVQAIWASQVIQRTI